MGMGKGDVKVYDYRYGLDYALCQGPVDSINYIWIKDKRAFCGSVIGRKDICVSDDKLFGGDSAEGGINGVIECYLGTDDQESSTYLARRMGFDQFGDIAELNDELKKQHYTKAPAYPGIAHLFFRRAGTDRGGFKWGTNNPYLPAVKASVTKIPRALDTRWAAIRPLNAVYAAGQQPDQQDPNSYTTGVAVPVGDVDSFDVREIREKLVWNNGSVFSYFPSYWYRNQDPTQVVALDEVGVCDTGYKEAGFNPQDSLIRLLSDGTPANYNLPPAENIATGAAIFRVTMEAIVTHVTAIGAALLEVAHNGVIQQLAADANGQPGEQVKLDWLASSANRMTQEFSVHPRCRFVRVALSSNPRWIYNRIAVIEQKVEILWPQIDFEHCSMEDTIGDLPDANPSHIVYDLLLDEGERENANMVEYIDQAQLRVTAQTLFNEGFGLSIRQDESLDRQSLLKSIAEHTKGAIFQNPETGKWNYKLFRNDYVAANLQAVGKSDCRIVSGSRRAWSQCISEITVEYTDPQEEGTASVTSHNDRGAAITGNRVPETRSFQFIRNSALAQIVADREVVEASYPLWSGTLEMSRKFWKLTPGTCLRLTYVDEDFQIENMVIRVTNVDFGEVTSRKISVEVVEDIYSVDKTTYRSPQSPISDSEDNTLKPVRTTKPQYMIPMSLPYALIERMGNLDTITDSEQHYRTILFGSLDYRLDGVSVYTRDYITNMQELSYSTSPTPVTRMPESLNYSVQSYISQTTIERILPDGAVPGTVLMVSPDISTDDVHWTVDIERKSELVELDEFDGVNSRWSIKRALFDTVPRQWAAGALLWAVEDAVDNAQLTNEILDPNESPYPWWGKSESGSATTSNYSMWKVPVNTSARNQLPTRPGNVQINGIGPDPLIDTAINSTVTDLAITWSTRNKESEEPSPPWWSDGNFVAEAGETYIVRLRDPDDSTKVRYESVPLTGTSHTVPVSAIAPRGVVFVEVWAVNTDGEESLMASQIYVQIDKVAIDYQGWDYQWGRNWSGTATI